MSAPVTYDKVVSDLLEPLAAIEHERWSHWQRYMHSKCIPQDGALLIPAELVQRWERQLNTPYAGLTDKEKESDREQVRVYLPLIEKALRRMSSPRARKSASAATSSGGRATAGKRKRAPRKRRQAAGKRKQSRPQGRKSAR
jgi:hypothetical protein